MLGGGLSPLDWNLHNLATCVRVLLRSQTFTASSFYYLQFEKMEVSCSVCSMAGVPNIHESENLLLFVQDKKCVVNAVKAFFE